MTEQEAQQAQTIKRIGEMLNTPWGHDVGVWVANCEDLREIVDSQAQKIAHLEHKRTRAFQICHANIKWQREQRKLQAQKIAEQAKEFESAKSLAGIATKRYFEAKQNAEKYRNAYVEESARKYGHHPKSMIQAELLPWERWDNEAKKIIDLTEITDSKEVAR
jgi:uncharacterized protein (DUF1697 family)